MDPYRSENNLFPLVPADNIDPPAPSDPDNDALPELPDVMDIGHDEDLQWMHDLVPTPEAPDQVAAPSVQAFQLPESGTERLDQGANSPDENQVQPMSDVDDGSTLGFNLNHAYAVLDEGYFGAETSSPVAPNLKLSPLRCDICGHTFTTKHNLGRHVRRQHGAPQDQPTTSGAREAAGPSRPRCNICGSTFARQRTLDKHVRDQHHPPEAQWTRHPCDNCGVTFSTAYVLQNHKLSHHFPPQVAPCDNCTSTFATKEQLRTHRRKAHHNDMHQCEQCGYFTKTSSNMNVHIKRCHGPGAAHKCKVCGAFYQTTFQLDLHLKREHKQ